MKIDGFMVAMIVAIAAAVAWPEVGATQGPLRLGLLTDIGIAIVFFLHGAGLSPQALRSGAAHWRLHLLVQSTTFVLFPLIGALIWFGTRAFFPEGLRLGFFYLCALPSTIASSVAMTALARGNVPVSIFNATLSGLLGMVLTPILVGLVSTLGAGGPSVGDAILAVARTLLLPFAAGQLCRSLIGGWIGRNKRVTSLLDRGVIVLIVYASFCESTLSGIWSRFGIGTLALVTALAALLLAAALLYTSRVSRALGFARGDEAAAVFGGSKKSLANGAPMANILFAGNPAVGMIMLPVLIYHQIQLVVGAHLARRYAEAEGTPVS